MKNVRWVGKRVYVHGLISRWVDEWVNRWMNRRMSGLAYG